MSAQALVRAITLGFAGVRLEPLAHEHRAALREAGKSPEIWAHMPYAAHGRSFDAWFEHSLDVAATGAEAVWAVRSPDSGALVGSTRFLAIEAAHRRLEIGSTWYSPDSWGTRVNPACKLALMRYAFEDLGFNRVEYKTDIRNERSPAAIAKLGAVREGVLRTHMIRPDGSLRDSVYFSVVAGEWPAVRERLAERLFEAA